MNFAPKASGLHMLIADDDHSLYCRRFQDEFRGKVCVSAVDCGDLAVRLFQEHDYDFVVLDCMPGSGSETARKIREISGSVKLAGLSASWNDENSKEAGLNYYSPNSHMVIGYIKLTMDQIGSEA